MEGNLIKVLPCHLVPSIRIAYLKLKKKKKNELHQPTEGNWETLKYQTWNMNVYYLSIKENMKCLTICYSGKSADLSIQNTVVWPVTHLSLMASGKSVASSVGNIRKSHLQVSDSHTRNRMGKAKRRLRSHPDPGSGGLSRHAIKHHLTRAWNRRALGKLCVFVTAFAFTAGASVRRCCH